MMRIKTPFSTPTKTLPIAMVLIALAILVADAFTDLVIDVGISYIAVILLSARVYKARGIVVVTALCAILCLVGYLISPGDQLSGPAIANRFLDLAAMATVTFLTLRDQSAQTLLRQTQAELAHATRVATIGQLTASIAHEVSQPIAAAVINARAGLYWLGADPPDLDEVRQTLGAIIREGERATDIIGRIRGLVKKAPLRKEIIAINDVILDVIALTQCEILTRRVALKTDLAATLPRIQGDRVQLQQVVLNLILNAVEAMRNNKEVAQELWISSTVDGADHVLVTVRDTGPGLDPKDVDRLFEAFYTTKTQGMGLGLSLSRSIIEAHGGRLTAGANVPRGAMFQFTVPAQAGGES